MCKITVPSAGLWVDFLLLENLKVSRCFVIAMLVCVYGGTGFSISSLGKGEIWVYNEHFIIFLLGRQLCQWVMCRNIEDFWQMDGRTANTPTHVSASDVPGVPLMPKKPVFTLCSGVAQRWVLEEQNQVSLWAFICHSEGHLLVLTKSSNY